MAAVTAETKVAARAEYRLTQKLVGPFHDDTGKITPRDPWNRSFMHLTLHVFDIARIDRCRLYLYQYFPGRRSRQGNLLDMQIIQAAALVKF